jgi:hypothetical protein
MQAVKQRNITFTRLVRGRPSEDDRSDLDASTPGERMEAVWELTPDRARVDYRC